MFAEFVYIRRYILSIIGINQVTRSGVKSFSFTDRIFIANPEQSLKKKKGSSLEIILKFKWRKYKSLAVSVSLLTLKHWLCKVTYKSPSNNISLVHARLIYTCLPINTTLQSSSALFMKRYVIPYTTLFISRN